MLACIILNYNSADECIRLYNRIKCYRVIDEVIIVDGHSTDNSANIIRTEAPMATFIEADKNGGYGYGNNLGLRYCVKQDIDYALISNPDVEFTEDSIKNTLQVLIDNINSVAAAPCMEGKTPGIKLPSSPWKDMLFSIMVLNKIFKPRSYSPDYFTSNNPTKVDAVTGSLVMFNVKKFQTCNFYDENIFLYHEEATIGKKFEKAGFETYVLPEEKFHHERSTTVDREITSAVSAKRIVLKSHRYYLKKYLKANRFQLFVFDYIIRPIAIIEATVWKMVKNAIMS